MRETGDRVEDQAAFGQALVLHNLGPSAVTDRFLAIFQCLDAANVDANRRIELQRLSTRRRLGTVVHHDTVDEVVVVALDLDIEAMHRAGLRLHMNVEDPRRHWAFRRLQ